MTTKQLSESLVRKIKISRIVNIKFFGVEKEIMDFINSKLDDLIVFNTPKHSDCIFYMSPSGDYIFEIYTSVSNSFGHTYIRENLWIDSGFFGKLLNKHGFIRSELGMILQQAISKAINRKVPLATDSTYERRMLIEMLYKQHIKRQENELNTKT